MYTRRKTQLGKLRSYYVALSNQYADLLRRRRFAEAREVFDLRRRVYRSILLREEFAVDTLPVAA